MAIRKWAQKGLKTQKKCTYSPFFELTSDILTAIYLGWATLMPLASIYHTNPNPEFFAKKFWQEKEMTYHICARIFCGNPVCRKTFFISIPETKPSLSQSVCLNSALNLSRSPRLTTQGIASISGPAGLLISGWKKNICRFTFQLDRL